MLAVCQACGSDRLRDFYEVRDIPVHSCLMVASREDALAFPRGDLVLGFCEACGFIQNRAFDPGVHNYSPDYEETQSFSPRFMEFARSQCESQIERHGLGPDKEVLEIGCGKGEWLVMLCELSGARGIGIDPGYRPERTESTAADRIRFIQDFYSESYTHLSADYVACRHTLEHIQPVADFVGMVRRTLDARPETTVFFELPDVERVLVEQGFWDLYYEHCTYFTLGSLARLVRARGFELLDLYKEYDGQYLMIECRPGDPAKGRRFDVEEDLARTAEQVAEFERKIQQKFAALREDLARYRREGLKVALWGSGSKCVSYLTTLGVGDLVECVVDINPHKHGKFLAGTGHEIFGPAYLKDFRPDVVIAMNPIYLDEIRSDLAAMGLQPELSAL